MVRAQQSGTGQRRLGVLTALAAGDPLVQGRVAALKDGFAGLGWKEGGNLQIEWRYGEGNPTLTARSAAELVASAPDVLLAITTPCLDELRKRTNTIPIVFASVTDPVGQGFVKSLAQPSGNITGFTDFDPAMAGKWLGMFAQLSPPVRNLGVLFNPETAPFAGAMLRTIDDNAPTLAVRVSPMPVHEQAAIGDAIVALSRERNAGLLVLPDSFTSASRATIIAAAALARLPAVYWSNSFVADGGLMSYGIDINDLYRRAASYIDRILRGTRPGDLPVQNPTKFDLAINLKTAKALGVTLSPTLLAGADEVIE
jgi:putative ABC transport system substrate-binding protein